MKNVLILLSIFCISCGNEKQKDVEKGHYSLEKRKDYFDPVHYYKDRDGNIWSKDNIWGVPRENESINDAKFRRKHSSSDGEDAYQRGYEKGKRDGYEEGYEEGSSEEQ